MKINSKKIFIYIVLLLLAAIVIFPFLWTIYVSLLKDVTKIEKFPLNIREYGLQNYMYLFSKIQVKSWYFNSIAVAFGITFTNLIINTMAGYSLARLNFPGKNIIFMIIIGVMLVPYQVTMIPVYILLSKWGFINSYAGLIIPFTFNSFGIFLMRQFFLTVPKELEEAATIDGLSRYEIFTKVMVPLAITPLVTQFIIIFMWNWNSFIWPSILVNKPEMYTLSVGINTIKSQYFSMPTTVMAGVIILTLPVIVLFILFQKYFIQGISKVGIKG